MQFQIAFVMPSSSARCAQLPRAADKVPFYDALRKLRDHLLGRIGHLDDSEVTFPNLELKCKKEEPDFEQNTDDDQIGLTAPLRMKTSSDQTGSKAACYQQEQCHAMDNEQFLNMLEMHQHQQQEMMGVSQAFPVTTACGHVQYSPSLLSASEDIWQYPCTSVPSSYSSTSRINPNGSLPLHGITSQQFGQSTSAVMDLRETYNHQQHDSQNIFATSRQQSIQIKSEPCDYEVMHG